MKIIKINPKNPEKDIIKKAIKVLKNGGVVVYPSGTCYGLAADVLNKKAIKKVFLIKGRKFKKPLSVVVFDIKMAEKIAFIDNRFKKLFRKFYKKPLTLVIKKRKVLPDILTGNLDRVGIRTPDSKVIQVLVKNFKKPLIATSANISGQDDIYSAERVFKAFENRKYKPDLVLDAGELEKVRPSTVLDLTEKKMKILRKGVVNKKEVFNVLDI